MPLLSALNQDFRYALRGFARAPLFTAIAALSIGLGIGANTAIFSLVDQLLLRPLPVAHPERLLLLDVPGIRVGFTSNSHALSYVAYKHLRDKNATFDGLLAAMSSNANFSYKGKSEAVPVTLASGNYFDVLGLRPAHGRLLSPSDDINRNGHAVAVLSYGYFKRRFGGDPSIVGQSVRINSHLYQVIGVAPAGFLGLEFDYPPNVYLPLSQKPQITTTWDGMDSANFYFLHVFGVLKPDVSPAQAKANLDALLMPVLEQEAQRFTGKDPKRRELLLAKRTQLQAAGSPLLEQKERLETALLFLQCIVGLVLLIACANVANLLLARASSRQREVAIRLAMGAGNWRLLRQLLVESTVLSLTGGVVGLLLSIWTLDAIFAILPAAGGADFFLNSAPDLRVMLFTLALSLGTGLLFGLTPVFQGMRDRIVDTLKEHTNGIIASASQGLFRRGLVVTQVTLSLLLLIAAGLFAKSLANLRQADPGFNTGALVSFEVDPSLNGYDNQRSLNTLDRIRQEIITLPGVSSVAPAGVPLLADNIAQATISIQGYDPNSGERTNARINSVGPGFFAGMGMPVLLGREFQESDNSKALKVAVVNDEFARRFLRGDALGKKIGIGRTPTGAPNLNLEIVGVVKDGKTENLREDKRHPFVYLPYMQDDAVSSLTFYVRSTRDPEQLVSELRNLLHRLDENLPMYKVQSMEATINRSLSLERLLAALCSAFGALATLLAGIGLYGVMAFSVAQRTREIGIRLALGADRSDVVGMVMREVALLAGLGTLIGLPAAFALGLRIESVLFGLKAWDPQILGSAALALGLVSLAAGFIPAWRASRVAPVTALRYE
jgi:predicted permease